MGCLLDIERTLGGVVIPIPATTPPKHTCLPLLVPSSKTGVLHDATSVGHAASSLDRVDRSYCSPHTCAR